MTVWLTIGNIGLFVLLGAFLTFVVLYLNVAGWWRTEMGRHVMAFMTSCLLAIGTRVSRLVWSEWTGYPVLRAITTWLAVFVVAWRIALLIKTQITNRRR